jgi:hypothetical protein
MLHWWGIVPVFLALLVVGKAIGIWVWGSDRSHHLPAIRTSQ